MLRIHQRFPLKKMTLYGSTAFIIGFSGTVAMLHEYAPRDDPGNTSVVHPSNKKDAKSNVSNQVPKNTDTSDQKTTADAATPLTQSMPVAGGGVLPTRQASPSSVESSSPEAMTVSPVPASSSPTIGNTPQPSGGSASTPTTTEPTPTTTAPTNPLPATSGLQDTVTNITKPTNLLP